MLEKLIHTADWHIGVRKSPMKDGVNLRALDDDKCLDALLEKSRTERPDLILVSGDIFDVGLSWSSRCCDEVLKATHYIEELAKTTKHIVVMRGTPNHDGAGQFNLLEERFRSSDNVHIVTTPTVLKFDDLYADVACIPGFDSGVFRAQHPGLSREEEIEVLTEELSNLVIGLKTQCSKNHTPILMAHYTVPGADVSGGQTMQLAKFEPMIKAEALQSADYELVALGHIHNGQKIGTERWFYSGSINAFNFNDEGQEKGFWVHEKLPFGFSSEFVTTPYRPFHTIHLSEAELSMINAGNIDDVAIKWRGQIDGKIVRIKCLDCSDTTKNAFNKASIERILLEDGAFMYAGSVLDNDGGSVNRDELGATLEPEENLKQYLVEKEFPPGKITTLIELARPLIEKAKSNVTEASRVGVLRPISISVKNYRNYKEETFDFENISFCTINGTNGSGKSSLFMDAILDCLYEEPREGELVRWIRNDEDARSGSICFTFSIGEDVFRVTRTRSKSGRPTLNVSELVNGEWVDRSKERMDDTNKLIPEIIGMDSTTFRSCALIMQDQYGLFLEADKEKRVAVLSTLLGLSIYKLLEKYAQDQAAEYRSKKNQLENSINLREIDLYEYEGVDKDISTAEAHVAELEADKKKQDELIAEKRALILSSEQVQEQRERIASSLSNKRLKVIDTRVKIAELEKDKEALNRELECENLLKQALADYNALSDQERVLSERVAVGGVKIAEKKRYEEQLLAEEKQIASLKASILTYEDEIKRIEASIGDIEYLESAAAKYDAQMKLYDESRELDMHYATLKHKLENAKKELADLEKTFTFEEQRIISQEKLLLRKSQMLESVECVDIENARCEFLKDAKNAAKELLAVREQMEALKESKESAFREKNEAVDAIASEMQDMQNDGYKVENSALIKMKLDEYARCSKQMELVKSQQSQIALYRGSIDNALSNIGEAQKRADMVKLKILEIENELPELQNMMEKHSLIVKQMTELKVYADKCNDLPLFKAKLEAANEQIAFQSIKIKELEEEIHVYEESLMKLPACDINLESLKAALTEMEISNKSLSNIISSVYAKLGALREQKKKADEIREELKDLYLSKNEIQELTTQFDVLKIAFSQSGVPHQIIRSIVPQLTNTANAILGQMTGGNMAVEFKLERLQKNGKEKGTLDIFIKEGSKPELPYLSKSGGEKVKASLSVILALAEIKSSAAGIQLGMLFIDEPPFLDGDGIQAYCDALETIQRRYPSIKVMAITHDPTMKARFPQSVDVVKTEEGSRVIY